MKYNPRIHNRRSTRLKGYDYSRAGLYFITICCQNRICRFGKVINKKMQLNEFGRIAYDEWAKLPDRFPNMIMDVFQIMPNHMHAIICLETPECESAHRDNIRATARVAPTPDSDSVSPPIDFAPAPTIGDIIGAYRSLVANECLAIYKSRNQNMGKLWQRNYNDHIIRNQHSYRRISNYIINNPADWDNDTFFEG